MSASSPPHSSHWVAEWDRSSTSDRLVQPCFQVSFLHSHILKLKLARICSINKFASKITVSKEVMSLINGVNIFILYNFIVHTLLKTATDHLFSIPKSGRKFQESCILIAW